MRTTVSISDSLLENAKGRAEERGITLSELVEDALRAHLAERKTRSRPFRLHTVRGRLVNPNLDLDRTSALLVSEDEAVYGERKD
jgi:Ribbon-helix-helix protein, copG family